MSEFDIYDKKLKNALRKLKNTKARTNLFEIGYMSSSYLLPEYYIASGFSKIKLDKISYSRDDKPKRTKAISIITPKGKMSWRRFSLLHPYAYWHLTEEMTSSDNWKALVKKLGAQNKIASYSTPRLDIKQMPQGLGVLAWKKLNESDVLKDTSGYGYLISTDIKNFYPSIYTHSIAWAIEGKPESRADIFGEALFGNHLDKLFQNSREGQTNGIPVGSAVSDITAEIILCNIDKRLSEILTKKKIKFVGARYRDDYKFLCPTQSEGEELLRTFSRLIQSEFDLHLNEDKTTIKDDIVIGSMRPWDLLLKESVIFSSLFNNEKKFSGSQIRTILLNTYSIQKKFPMSRVSIQIIGRLTKKLAKIKNFKLRWGDAEMIVALVRKIILLREDITPQAMLFLDLILASLPDKRKVELIGEMYKQFLNNDDNEYQEVWLYRLSLHHASEQLETLFGKSKNPLIQLLNPHSKSHWLYFETIDELSKNDTLQLEKFKLVDYKILGKSAGEPIPAEAINIFPRY